MSLPAALRRPARAALAAPLAFALLAGPAAADDLPADAPPAAPPPTIALAAPVPGGQIGAGVPAALTATVPGEVKVLSFHLDGGPPLCVFTRVHDTYACPWTPQPKDLGAHVVEARLTAPDGQTAVARSAFTVGRLLPAAVGAATSRRHLRSGGWRLTTTGAVAIPVGLSPSACSGVATVTVQARGRTLVDRSVPVGADCRFASRVTLAAPRRARALRVKVAFGGATLLAPRAAKTQTLHLAQV